MSILNQITIILVSSVFFGAILKFLKQPIFLAHIIVGLFVGTYFIGGFELRSSNQYFEIVASLLLFISGLTVNIKHLKDLGENTILKNILSFLTISIMSISPVRLALYSSCCSISCALAIQRAWFQMDPRGPHYRYQQRRTGHPSLLSPVSSACPSFWNFHSRQPSPAPCGSMQIYSHQTAQLSRTLADLASH